MENLPYKIIVSRRKVIFARFKYGNIHIAFCSEFLKFGDSNLNSISIIFSSVAQSCLILCDPMDCSMPGFPVHHQLPEFTQSHVHWVGDAIQPSDPLLSPSPPTLNLSQNQGLFQWVSYSHQMVRVLEFQLQRQSFQWISSFSGNYKIYSLLSGNLKIT